jgi:hypothetical protein
MAKGQLNNRAVSCKTDADSYGDVTDEEFSKEEAWIGKTVIKAETAG